MDDPTSTPFEQQQLLALAVAYGELVKELHNAGVISVPSLTKRLAAAADALRSLNVPYGASYIEMMIAPFKDGAPRG